MIDENNEVDDHTSNNLSKQDTSTSNNAEDETSSPSITSKGSGSTSSAGSASSSPITTGGRNTGSTGTSTTSVDGGTTSGTASASSDHSTTPRQTLVVQGDCMISNKTFGMMESSSEYARSSSDVQDKEDVNRLKGNNNDDETNKNSTIGEDEVSSMMVEEEDDDENKKNDKDFASQEDGTTNATDNKDKLITGNGKNEDNDKDVHKDDRADSHRQHDDEEHTLLHSTSRVTKAAYPIPDPLSIILSACLEQNKENQDNSVTPVIPSGKDKEAPSEVDGPSRTIHGTAVEPVLDSIPHALEHLLGNAFQALDVLYFQQTPTYMRNRPSFRHRLTIRVHCDVAKKQLTITDLGCGMTRADLINVFGVGSRLSSSALKASKVISKLKRDMEQQKRVIVNNSDNATRDETTSSTNATFEIENMEHHHHNHHAVSNPQEEESMDTALTSNNDEEEMSTTAGDAAAVAAHDDGDGRGTGTNHNDGTDDSSTDIYAEELEDYVNEGAKEMEESMYGDDAKKASSGTDPKGDNKVHIPCTQKDIGGVYAALCALGTKVNVGTKSKFDDLYEFEVGVSPTSGASTAVASPGTATINNSDKSKHSSYTHFTVTRPLEEGTVPTAENGYDKFVDIRGESGTRVTIDVSPDAIEFGILDENILKPILVKIFETSQYRCAFSTEDDAQDIINASKEEMLDREHVEKEENSTTISMDVPLLDEQQQQQYENKWASGGAPVTVKERSKYIPIRLSLGERKMLRLIESSMSCCDYTTEVDRPFKNRARRAHAVFQGITSVLRGIVTACDYRAGQYLVTSDDANYGEYNAFYESTFEIARRHKIMNPEKMRTEYGKLIYFLQDAVSYDVQNTLNVKCKGEIYTVYKFLEERGGTILLDDPHIETATREVLAERKSRAQINTEIKRKEKAVALIKQKYRTHHLSSDDIHLCLYSICDNNSFLNSNRVPIDKVIDFLRTYFSPDKIEEGYSLSIVSGHEGARLSHSHERQYYFALQSLTLWRDIINDMFRLWAMAEEDLLSESVTYSLKDTGQGMQRVQQSPKTYRAMQQILARVQTKVNKWIGSSVIHMGDHNVPNALSFIDKYTQVPRILGPIVSCLENVEKLCDEDEGIENYVKSAYGGLEKLRKDILYDFFKSAFDGSGADNFYDAGSCIDGRLTSAWNWCSQLSSKPYYPIFKLTGFIGFDGEFK